MGGGLITSPWYRNDRADVTQDAFFEACSLPEPYEFDGARYTKRPRAGKAQV